MLINFCVSICVSAANGFQRVSVVLDGCDFFYRIFKINVYSHYLAAGVVQLVRMPPCHMAVHW